MSEKLTAPVFDKPHSRVKLHQAAFAARLGTRCPYTADPGYRIFLSRLSDIWT